MDIQDEITITLRKPLTFGKGDKAQTFETVTLREPTAGELEAAARADTGVGGMLIIMRLQTGIPRQALEGMSQRDLKECNDFLESFSDESSPSTSESS